jgi:hypothetical protein
VVHLVAALRDVDRTPVAFDRVLLDAVALLVFPRERPALLVAMPWDDHRLEDDRPLAPEAVVEPQPFRVQR